MDLRKPDSTAGQISQEILGYLNFSSGAADPRFLGNLNQLFALLEEDDLEGRTGRTGAVEPTWQALGRVLRETLEGLRGGPQPFHRVDQAEAVLRLVFDAALPAYQNFHRDLLFHQTAEDLFGPFFVARLCQAVLGQGGPWDQTERIVSAALGRLNDYIGHRPVAVLRTQQKIQPYDHEWVAPIPLYVRGAGVAVGRYQQLVERALAIIQQTDPSLLFQAWFDPGLLDELALDPRAYDFDHPVNKRPNYPFGQWDLHRLDGSGRCRRFVVQQVSLDAMLQRVEDRGKLPREEALFEAAAVLAGTMLMGSGVSGNAPDAHGSETTLATLVQHIAVYRDAFYEQLLDRLSGPHAERLRAEAARLRQPLGGARQDFNHRLSRRRAKQLQNVHLAQVFARMGYTEAAGRQAGLVPVASARMRCEIDCRLSTARWEIERGRLQEAAALIVEIEDLLQRAIECGAMVDPWNILGFGGQYSLFPAVENSVPDHRIDELIELVGEIFALYVQAIKQAAAAGEQELRASLSSGLEKIGQWWDRFASLEVSAVEGISGQQTKQSADHVATALAAWHQAGTAAGDLAFWQGHVERFQSPKSYALVIEALLEQHDPVAAMALLIQWVSQADEISLVEENYSFHELALGWMEEVWPAGGQPAHPQPDRPAVAAEGRWPLSRKFLDFMEANAGEYWQVPQFELAVDAEEEEKEEDSDSLFSAAYEGVTYRDSTDDGFDGQTFEGEENATDFELVREADRIITRLGLLGTLAKLWKRMAVASTPDDDQRELCLAGWLDQAVANQGDLLKLLSAIHRHRLPAARGTHQSMVEYDRHRAVKEMLLEQVIAACVETADAARMIRASMQHPRPAAGTDAWEEPAGEVLRAALHADTATVRAAWDDFVNALRELPLIYVALERGGSPRRIVASRSIQCVLRRLLAMLPRLGLLEETCRLIETIHQMETRHPVRPGAITEFDRMFRSGYEAIARCLVVSSQRWYGKRPDADQRRQQQLIACLEDTTEALLRCWLAHSRGVRLSVLEAVHHRGRWRDLSQFIECYGGDLFTQRFMELGNLRAILHQGVDAYLDGLAEGPPPEDQWRLLADLDRSISREDAAYWLGLAIQAVVENYLEYVDYNATTTQSDRGELLYTLLDFLRLRADYERMSFNLLPVLLTHGVLVRCGRDEAAESWRKAVSQRTADIAEHHLRRYARLSRKYGMRLASVAGRLGERFVRPLAIDRLRALVRPAIDELRGGRPPTAFARLEEELVPFTEEISGTGFETPAWIEALELEVERVRSPGTADDELLDPPLDVPQVQLSIREARRQIKAMAGDQ